MIFGDHDHQTPEYQPPGQFDTPQEKLVPQKKSLRPRFEVPEEPEEDYGLKESIQP